MLIKRDNHQKSIYLRITLLLLTLLLSKNIKIEVISSDFEFRASTESLSFSSITKLIELF